MTALLNRARGEAALQIDGAPVRLCLTLGALARLEAAFEAPSLEALGRRLATLTAGDLLVIVAALTGAGDRPYTVSELGAARIDLAEAADAVAEAFRLGLGDVA